jgi:hypothetical protein
MLGEIETLVEAAGELEKIADSITAWLDATRHLSMPPMMFMVDRDGERLSEVPEDQFEAALAKRVTARGIIDDYARRNEPAKKSILKKSLLPPGTDVEAWAQQERWNMIFHHLEVLCASVDDVEHCTRAKIAAGRVTPENVACLARLGLALTNATGDILAKAGDTFVHLMTNRRDSSLN